jgi:hypothetical protein
LHLERHDRLAPDRSSCSVHFTTYHHSARRLPNQFAPGDYREALTAWPRSKRPPARRIPDRRLPPVCRARRWQAERPICATALPEHLGWLRLTQSAVRTCIMPQ